MSERSLRNSISSSYHTFVKRGISGFTASSRVLPDFIIIGTVRSGSTSLYYNICEHPSVLSADYDEIGFFDSNYHLGVNWYRSMFPTKKKMDNLKKTTGFAITGEDTPFYFWKKEVSERIFKLLPNVKIISIFRNPIDRAYSNYNLGIRLKTEELSFEDAIEDEMKYLEENSFRESIERRRSYLSKGIYANQIQNWLEIFPNNQIHMISTEEMQKNPIETLQKVFKFLDITDYEIPDPQKQKSADYKKMNFETRQKLLKFYQPHNEIFFDIIKQRFEWNS